MRILYHHRTLGDGAEGIHIREMVNAFRVLGHDVQVAALVGEGEADGKPSAHRSSAKSRLLSMASEYLPEAAYEFAEIAYNWSGRRSISRAIKSFDPDLIYDRYNSFCTAATDAGKKHGVPVFLEVNAPLAYERSCYERRALRFSNLAARYERSICRSAAHLFAVSTPLKEFLVETHGVAEDQVTVLPNGVNTQVFDWTIDGTDVRRSFGIESKTVIGFVGFLRPWHGVETLIDAMQTVVDRCPDAHLLIVGDGVIEPDLKSLARSLGIEDNVTFAGRVPHQDISHYVAAMDIAVSPKSTFYACPMKILEYMAMGIPTVAPGTGNIRDILVDGENSLLFAEDDATAMIDAIVKLIDDESLTRRLGEQARACIEEKHSWVSVAQNVLREFTGTRRNA